jgi:hypothetical protein
VIAIPAILLLFGVAQPVPPAAAERLFDAGDTWEQFLGAVVMQQELWRRTAADAAVSADFVERVRRAGRGLQLLVVAEDWCPDSAYSVPYVARLAASAQVPLRIVDRLKGESLMRTHRTNDGRTVTPIVVVLRQGADVGAWIERPLVLQKLFRSMSSSPDNARQFAERGKWYEADRGVTVLTEVVALIEQTRAAK